MTTKTYLEGEEIKGEIVKYGYNSYRMRDTNGVIWETKEATCDGYVMRDYKEENGDDELIKEFATKVRSAMWFAKSKEEIDTAISEELIKFLRT